MAVPPWSFGRDSQAPSLELAPTAYQSAGVWINAAGGGRWRVAAKRNGQSQRAAPGLTAVGARGTSIDGDALPEILAYMKPKTVSPIAFTAATTAPWGGNGN
jgi:hypothetical protein